MHKIPVIAHRGASGYEPENTLAAFQAALDLQADAIELDVQVCKTGEVLVFHDNKLKRMTGKKGKLKRKTLAGIMKLDAGKGEHIPLLTEVLDQLDARIRLNIELKGKRTALPTAMVVRHHIRTGHWKTEDFIVSSFRMRELRRFHEVCPDIPIGLLYNRKLRKLKKRITQMAPVSVHLNAAKIRPEWVKTAHEHELKVYVWTVDDPQVARLLVADGVDGFFTNYPDRMIKQRGTFKS